MLKAVQQKTRKINKKIKILGVTVLTSLNNKSLREIGYTKKVKQLVLKQADLIKKSNCDGIDVILIVLIPTSLGSFALGVKDNLNLVSASELQI